MKEQLPFRVTFCLREPNCQLSGIFAKIIVCFAITELLIRLLFAVVHLILMPLLVVFAFLDCSSFHSICGGWHSWCSFKWPNMFITNLIFPSTSLQVTTYPVNQARLLSHQLRHHTGSIHPSRRSAAAHWPIRGARARHPQPAWRPTCRVRQNASSCRTAGSWVAMWPWKAGEWPEASTSTSFTF